MVQTNNRDYNKQWGCCLSCPYKRHGCLCRSCRCTRCYWYCKSVYMEHGRCDLVLKLRGETYG